MGLSRKQAALNLHGWMRAGRKYVAHQTRGEFLHPLHGKKCNACALGAIALGKLGGYSEYPVEYGYVYFQDYGPKVSCPAAVCEWGGKPLRSNVGYVTEHLFEDHGWNFARIEHWLAECADLPRVAA